MYLQHTSDVFSAKGDIHFEQMSGTSGSPIAGLAETLGAWGDSARAPLPIFDDCYVKHLLYQLPPVTTRETRMMKCERRRGKLCRSGE